MRSLFVTAMGLLATTFAACDVNRSTGLSQRDVDAIRAVQDKYVSTALAGDWDAWATTLTDNAVLMPPGVAPLKDRDAIVAWVKSIPKLSAFTLPENEIAGSRDIAYGRGTYTFTIADTSEVVEGVRTELFRKQPDGSWLYSGAMFHPTPVNPVAVRAADESGIRALVKDVEGTVNARDFASYANLFAEDADIVVDDLERATGRQALRTVVEDGWKGQPAGCRMTLHNDSIRLLSADVAVIEDHATLNGCKNLAPGRDTAVLVRRDGKWRIAALRIYPLAK